MSDNAADRSPGSPPAPSGMKRFYTTASVGPKTASGDVPVLLDGRAVRTPGKRPLALPTAALAEAIAVEWQAQATRIDPASMPLTRLANTALDGVVGKEAEVAADLVAFSGSDLVCYRADHPADLVARQAAAWDPVLAWAADSLGARFVVAVGILHVPQPAAATDRIAALVTDRPALELCALHVMTTLTGSALIALAHAEGHITVDAAWTAAHVDEDFVITQWGEDQEAAERRAFRYAEMTAASRMLGLLRP